MLHDVKLCESSLDCALFGFLIEFYSLFCLFNIWVRSPQCRKTLGPKGDKFQGTTKILFLMLASDDTKYCEPDNSPINHMQRVTVKDSRPPKQKAFFSLFREKLHDMLQTLDTRRTQQPVFMQKLFLTPLFLYVVVVPDDINDVARILDFCIKPAKVLLIHLISCDKQFNLDVFFA